MRVCDVTEQKVAKMIFDPMRPSPFLTKFSEWNFRGHNLLRQFYLYHLPVWEQFNRSRIFFKPQGVFFCYFDSCFENNFFVNVSRWLGEYGLGPDLDTMDLTDGIRLKVFTVSIESPTHLWIRADLMQFYKLMEEMK